MKAVVYHKYGPPDVLQCEDVEKPIPRDNEVLIRVRAAALNPLDWHFMRGAPSVLRLSAGLSKPKDPRVGVDVAGEVEAAGSKVTQFKPGDCVFGSCRGAFAEYACTPEASLAIKPDNVTFEQAAAVPVAGYSALQGLRDEGRIQSGQRVLINGAAGGVGTFAVQIARWFGAHVTGVCSTRNLELVRSIGADRVIDYTREDFTQLPHCCDVLLDCVGNHSLSDYRRVLSPRGIHVPVGGKGDRLVGTLIQKLVLKPFVRQKLVIFFLARPNQQDLLILRDLMKKGHVTPVIDRCYKLSEIADAMRYLEEGHARGKVVISLDGC